MRAAAKLNAELIINKYNPYNFSVFITEEFLHMRNVIGFFYRQFFSIYRDIFFYLIIHYLFYVIYLLRL